MVDFSKARASIGKAIPIKITPTPSTSKGPIITPNKSGESSIGSSKGSDVAKRASRGGSSLYNPTPTPTPQVSQAPKNKEFQNLVNQATRSNQGMSSANTVKQTQSVSLNKQFLEQEEARQREQSYIPRRETISNYQPTNRIDYSGPPLSSKPLLYEENLTPFKAPDGKVIPVKQLRYYPGLESMNPKGGEIETRQATKEEEKYFKEQTSVLQTSNRSYLARAYGETSGQFKENVKRTNLGVKENLERLGATNENIEKSANILTALTPKLTPQRKEREFLSSTISSMAIDFKERPLQGVVSFGLGAATGLAFEGAPIAVRGGLSMFSKTKSIAPTAEKVTKFATVSTGLGLGTFYTAKESYYILSAPDVKTAGQRLGTELIPATSFIKGVGKGVYGARFVEGELGNIGRKTIELESGVYPQAPINKQLSLFKSNVVPELGKEPIAFHATSSKFWDNKLIPKDGSSEIAGLYASTQVSKSFLRLPGSGSSLSFKPTTIFKSLFQTGKPSIAALKPVGFRESNVAYSKIKLFEEQKYIKGKGFAYFAEPPRKGFMDVPGIKTEIESIARPDAGEYLLESKQFATRIDGIKISLDTLKSEYFKEPRQSKIKIKSNEKEIKFDSKKLNTEYKSINIKSPRYESFGLSSYSKSSSQLSSSLGLSSSVSKGYSSTRSYNLLSSSPIPSGGSYPSPISSKALSGSSGGYKTDVPYYPISSSKYYPLSSYNNKSFEGFSIPKTKSRGYKFSAPIAPSFTGIVTNVKIKGPVKVSKTFGVTPFQARGILTNKGPYSKLTSL